MYMTDRVRTEVRHAPQLLTLKLHFRVNSYLSLGTYINYLLCLNIPVDTDPGIRIYKRFMSGLVKNMHKQSIIEG